jgi:hypothetical protein
MLSLYVDVRHRLRTGRGTGTMMYACAWGRRWCCVRARVCVASTVSTSPPDTVVSTVGALAEAPTTRTTPMRRRLSNIPSRVPLSKILNTHGLWRPSSITRSAPPQLPPKKNRTTNARGSSGSHHLTDSLVQPSFGGGEEREKRERGRNPAQNGIGTEWDGAGTVE